MPATPFARDTSRSLEKDPLSSALQLSCFYGNHNFWNMCLCSVLFLTSSVYFFAILLPPETLSYSSFSPLNHLQAKFFFMPGAWGQSGLASGLSLLCRASGRDGRRRASGPTSALHPHEVGAGPGPVWRRERQGALRPTCCVISTSWAAGPSFYEAQEIFLSFQPCEARDDGKPQTGLSAGKHRECMCEHARARTHAPVPCCKHL